jgi:hypothetical protein
MPKRKNNKTNSVLWFLAILGVAVLLGLAAYVTTSGSAHVPPDLARRKPSGPAQSHPRPTQVHVFKPSFEGGRLSFSEDRSVTTGDVDPMVYALNQFLQASAVAPGAKALSVTVSGGVASADFNDAFQREYGTEDEQTLLQGIQRTMGQFHDVRAVQILVAGERIDTIGSVDLTAPLPVIR